MKKQLICLPTILLLFSFCKSELQSESSNVVDVSDESFFPNVQDTFSLNGIKKSVDKFHVSNYKPIYFGQDSSNLYVDYLIQNYWREPAKVRLVGKEKTAQDSLNNQYWNKYQSYFPLESSENSSAWDSAEVLIHIDTSQSVKNITIENWGMDTIVYKSYPVLLKNESNKDIVIGYGAHIPMILEIERENWNQIELEYAYRCGNGLTAMILPKNEIVLTSVPITTGKSKVLMRLKLGSNYSNEFWGYLDLDSLNAR